MHRDVKPENILLRNKNDPNSIVVADFGLATFKRVENVIFKRCGTPGLVAPEIIKYEVKKRSLINFVFFNKTFKEPVSLMQCYQLKYFYLLGFF
jgi:serine/threonine protein kinase